MPRGYQSKHRDTHEIMLFASVSGFRVSRLATILHYTELCTRDSIRMDSCHLVHRGGSYWKRSREVHLVVGSGPVPYTLLARLSICL